MCVRDDVPDTVNQQKSSIRERCTLKHPVFLINVSFQVQGAPIGRGFILKIHRERQRRRESAPQPEVRALLYHTRLHRANIVNY